MSCWCFIFGSPLPTTSSSSFSKITSERERENRYENRLTLRVNKVNIEEKKNKLERSSRHNDEFENIEEEEKKRAKKFFI